MFIVFTQVRFPGMMLVASVAESGRVAIRKLPTGTIRRRNQGKGAPV